MAAVRNVYLFSRNPISKNILNWNTYQSPLFIVPIRTAKHYDPKWKWFRKRKVIPVDLSYFENKGKGANKEIMRTRMKELGMQPPRFWQERPITVTSLNEIYNPYVPPEGDGKTSFVSKIVGKKAIETLATKKDYILAMRKIKSYESNFDVKVFPQMAQDIYIKAHTSLMKKNPDELAEFATDKAINDMLNGIKYQTINWSFVKSLEPPVVVHAVVSEILVKQNLCAQLTVRFHTQQKLAIYDRFGRLIYGSEEVPKDVLEYVVFEKHIVNEYGLWRLHGKIIPDWMGPQLPSARTYKVEKLKEEGDEEDDVFDFDNSLKKKVMENFAEAEVFRKQEAEKAEKETSTVK